MMFITNAKTAAGTTEWILKIQQNSTFPFSMWPVPIGGQSCREKSIKTAEAFSYIADIQNGREPYFGLELWF